MNTVSKDLNQASGNLATFSQLKIPQAILMVLQNHRFITPTPIQEKAIPIAIEGKDVVGIAQTGTGKSLAFGIPLIAQLMASPQKRGLIVLPTRELALQINEVLQKIGGPLAMTTTVLIGGAPMGPQIRSLRQNPRIIIATPGRLNDHIQQRTIQLTNVGILVLDEADAMFDMGFAPQIKKILAVLPKERQTMLFSATMPEAILSIASGHMKLPVRVEIARQGTTNAKVDQELLFLPKERKGAELEKILLENQGSVLIFSRTKHGARKICHNLLAKNMSAIEIHSNKSLMQRQKALAGFKSGKFRILVATDIASRGIDVKGISLVINYDLPENAEDYVHRIGRTGRAGMVGKAISLVTADQKNKVRQIERLIRATIPAKHTPGFVHQVAPTSTRPWSRSQNSTQNRFQAKRKFYPKSWQKKY